MNQELPDVQSGFRKGRGTRDQIANIHWVIEKPREFHKNIDSCLIDYAKAFDGMDHNKLGKFIKRWEYQSTRITCLLRKLKKQPDMEQWTGSKLGKGYVKAVYCHLAY